MRYTPSRGVKPCKSVTKTITGAACLSAEYHMQRYVDSPAMAIPRSFHRVAVVPAASSILRITRQMNGSYQTSPPTKHALGCEHLPHGSVTYCSTWMIDMALRTIQFDAVKPKKIALVANKMVARCRGLLNDASRYTFSPPERGIMVPNSNQMNNPQKDRANPRTQSIIDAPTDPTVLRIEDGVEKIPVPMMWPTLVMLGYQV